MRPGFSPAADASSSFPNIDTKSDDDKKGAIIQATQSNTGHSSIAMLPNSDNEDMPLFYVYPTDFMHGLLAAHPSEESGIKAGKSLIKDGDNVDFKLNPHFFEMFPDEKDRAIANNYLAKWKVYKVIEDAQTGYLGVIYFNEADKQIVLSHRPTHFALGFGSNKLKQSGAATDIESVLMGRFVMHQAYGYLATVEAIKYSKEKGFILSVTGHSLGSWLAELSVFYCATDLKYPYVKGVTFDGPGGLEMIEQMNAGRIRGASDTFDLKDLDLTKYVSPPNLVNCTNKHLGTVYRWYKQINETLPVPSVVGRLIGKENLDAVLATWGHHLKYILPNFDVKTGMPLLGSCKRVIKWPSITHKEFGHSEKSLFSKHGKEATESLLDGSSWIAKKMAQLGINIGNTILGKIFSKESTTFGSIIYALRDLASGKINQEQFWKVHEFLDRSNRFDIKAGATLIANFELLFKGQYQVEDVVYYKKETDQIDYYLGLLKEKEAMLFYSTLNGDAISKIKWLLKRYDHNFAEKRNEIKPEYHNRINIDMLRGFMVALLITYKKEIEAFINTKIKIGKIASFTNVKKIPISKFIGRKEDFRRIDKAFEGNKVVIVNGAPGVGKTALVREYERQCKESNVITIRLNADSRKSLIESYREFGMSLGLPVENIDEQIMIRMVNDAVYANGQEVLFIFDDIQSREVIDETFLKNLPLNVKLLITSRNPELLGDSCARVKVDPFDQKDMEEYFRQNLPGLRRPDIDLLVGELKMIPQHLSIAVAYFKENGFNTVKDFITELSRNDKRIFNTVLDKLVAEAPLAWEILQYISRLNPDAIPVKELLLIIFENRDKNQVWQALKVLERLSLIEIIGEFGSFEIRIHKAVQEECIKYVENHSEKSIKTVDILTKLFEVLNNKMPAVAYKPDDRWQLAKILEPNVRSMIEYLEAQNIKLPIDNILAELCTKLGRFYRKVFSNFNEAFKWFDKALQLNQKINNENNPELATALNNMGNTYKDLGGVNNALIYCKKALDMRIALNDKKYEADIATSYNNLGEIYRESGDLKKALENHQEALRRRKTLYTNSANADLASSFDRVGKVFLALDDHKNARFNCEESLKMRLALYQNNHPDIATSYSNLGEAQRRSGDNKSALESYKKALHMRQILYPQGHPYIAISLNNVGEMYRNLGSAEEALIHCKKALAIREKVYPFIHPIIADSLESVAQAYISLDDKKAALEYSERALKIRQCIYMQNHPHVIRLLICIGNIAKAMGDIGKDKLYKSQAQDCKSNAGNSTFINNRGDISSMLYDVKIKIQVEVLNKIQQLSVGGIWSHKTCLSENGIIGYLDDEYLGKQLGNLNNDNNLKIARKLCFEAICIGTMNSTKKDTFCVQQFAQRYPILMEEIANQNPEYFVDHKLATACLSKDTLIKVITPAYQKLNIQVDHVHLTSRSDIKDVKGV